MRQLFFIITAVLVSACSDENEGFVVDTGLDIAVRDSAGNDLLDPQNPSSFKEGEIRLFYLRDGKAVEFFEGHRGYSIYEHEHEFRLGVSLNSDKNEEFPVTILQWNTSDMDTLKCHIRRRSGSVICDKVWLNEDLVWEAYKTERFIEMIK